MYKWESCRLNNIIKKLIKLSVICDDEEKERFDEDVEAVMELHKTQYSFIIGEFIVKVGEKKKSFKFSY